MKRFLISLLVLAFVSCQDENKAVQTETLDFTAQNEKDIQSYIEEHSLNAQKSDSGLYYVIQEPGTGKQPTASSDVKVAYKGYFLNKTVFDESDADGITFNLQQVIKGWTEGITYFKEGGEGILLVPSHLGYGSFDKYGIPGGSVLLFEINLITVE